MIEQKSLLQKIRYYTSRAIARCLPDKVYLSIKFRTRFGYWMNWKHPQTYNEKLQWLKVYDRHEEFTQMVDKVAAKQFVKSIIGEKFIIATIKVYNSADEINFEELPNQFVLKCTHDSGGIVVCNDKSKLDVVSARKKLAKGLKRTYVVQNREYPYAKVPRRIIAEKYMEDESGYELKDYKIFCFDGKPKFLFVASDRQKVGEDVKFDFFDLNWNHLPVLNGHANSLNKIPKPTNFEEMIQIAEKLSKGFRHVRVDLYNINGQVYFGELTFFHFSGTQPFEPREWDYKFGAYLHLPTDDV